MREGETRVQAEWLSSSRKVGERVQGRQRRFNNGVNGDGGVKADRGISEKGK